MPFGTGLSAFQDSSHKGTRVSFIALVPVNYKLQASRRLQGQIRIRQSGRQFLGDRVHDRDTVPS
ncbi:hypothetical protein GCM10010261_65590 [Streptomyces pilosus]|nr:hypothetical protein GCM10010261_65590 [Streptomyces pilosus]